MKLGTHAIHKRCTKSSRHRDLSSIQGFLECYTNDIFREGRPSIMGTCKKEYR